MISHKIKEEKKKNKLQKREQLKIIKMFSLLKKKKNLFSIISSYFCEKQHVLLFNCIEFQVNRRSGQRKKKENVNEMRRHEIFFSSDRNELNLTLDLFML